MKKSFRFVVLLMMATMMCVSSVSAAVVGMRSSLYLDSYRAWLTAEDNGVISVAVDVQAVTYMDEVGASKIQIYESTDGGKTWDSVHVFTKAIYPEMVTEDEVWYYEAPVEYQGVAGRKYFAVVTAYAMDSTGYDEKEYNTAIVTARN